VTPRGVQLHLGTAAAPRLVDTLVMANLGYFQLKAGPGVFALRLAPGRSARLYAVDDSTDGALAEDAAQARCRLGNLPVPYTHMRAASACVVPVRLFTMVHLHYSTLGCLTGRYAESVQFQRRQASSVL